MPIEGANISRCEHEWKDGAGLKFDSLRKLWAQVDRSITGVKTWSRKL